MTQLHNMNQNQSPGRANLEKKLGNLYLWKMRIAQARHRPRLHHLRSPHCSSHPPEVQRRTCRFSGFLAAHGDYATGFSRIRADCQNRNSRFPNVMPEPDSYRSLPTLSMCFSRWRLKHQNNCHDFTTTRTTENKLTLDQAPDCLLVLDFSDYRQPAFGISNPIKNNP